MAVVDPAVADDVVWHCGSGIDDIPDDVSVWDPETLIGDVGVVTVFSWGW